MSNERSTAADAPSQGVAETWIRAHRAGAHPQTGELVGEWYLPRSVVACLTDAWSLLLERPTGAWEPVTYRCRSWRCPRCAWLPARETGERFRLTLDQLPQDELVFLTITLPRRGQRTPARELGGRLARWWRRLRYALGSGEGRARRRCRLRYALVWEAHADPRWLHAHAVVHSPALARELRRRGWHGVENRAKGRTERRYRLVEQLLQPLGVDLGLGRMDAQPVRSPRALATYCAKLAAELSGAGAKGQLPLLAPPRFRRIRSSPGFLQRLEREACPGILIQRAAGYVRDRVASIAGEWVPDLRAAAEILAPPRRRLRAPP